MCPASRGDVAISSESEDIVKRVQEVTGAQTLSTSNHEVSLQPCLDNLLPKDCRSEHCPSLWACPFILCLHLVLYLIQRLMLNHLQAPDHSDLTTQVLTERPPLHSSRSGWCPDGALSKDYSLQHIDQLFVAPMVKL